MDQVEIECMKMAVKLLAATVIGNAAKAVRLAPDISPSADPYQWLAYVRGRLRDELSAGKVGH